MIFHFNLSGSDASLYFSISTIRQTGEGLRLGGVLGDGSAEDWFEATIGSQIVVQLLPVWQAEDSLCDRFDQKTLELDLARQISALRFRSEGAFDRASGTWQQHYLAEKPVSAPVFRFFGRIQRPHQQACERPPQWRTRNTH